LWRNWNLSGWLCTGAGALHAPVLAKAALSGPSGDNAEGTLLNGGSAATTDANGLVWVASEWCGRPQPLHAVLTFHASEEHSELTDGGSRFGAGRTSTDGFQALPTSCKMCNLLSISPIDGHGPPLGVCV